MAANGIRARARRGRRAWMHTSLVLVLLPALLSGCILGIPIVPGTTGSGRGSAPSARPFPSTAPLPPPALLDGSATLDGVPRFAVVRVAETGSIEVSEWDAGVLTKLFDVAPSPSERHDLGVELSAAPDGRRFVLAELVLVNNVYVSVLRVVDRQGTPSWTASPGIQRPDLRWSPDGSMLALDVGGAWHVVSFATGAPVETEITTKRPATASGVVVYPWMLIGFSEDGQWLYGAEQTGGEPWFRVAVRAAVPDGAVTTIDAPPDGESNARLAAPHQTDHARVVSTIDPGTGSVLTTGCGGIGQACRVTVWRGSQGSSFTLPAGSSWINATWSAGSILATWTRPTDSGDVMQLSRFSVGGHPGVETPILTLPAPRGAESITGATDAAAVITYGTGAPMEIAELVVVRLSDGAYAVVRAGSETTSADRYGFGGFITER